MDVLSAWRHRGARVRYLYRTDSEHSADEFYVCLDGKFHSWISDEGDDDWIVRTVAEPHVVIKVPYAVNWIDGIS